MVSRQETARPLLTPGEVMQLPPTDELVLISGLAPIRARKLRYYDDRNFQGRVAPPPALGEGPYADRPIPRTNDWGRFARKPDPRLTAHTERDSDAAAGGLQQERHPGLPEEAITQPIERLQGDLLGFLDDEVDPVADARVMDRARSLVRVTSAHALNESAGRDDDLLPSF
jgi:type IV secretion system protein VirD4